jgi:hypothetical protein
MNTNRNLILIKGEDKTAEIRSWRYNKGRIIVTFQDGRTYQYGHYNVKFFKDPKVMSARDCIILKDNVIAHNVVRILDFGQYARIEYENYYTETLPSYAFQVIHSSLANPECNQLFSYLKDIACAISLTTEDGHNILGNHYKRINFIREDSALNSYLSGTLPDSCHSRQGPIIYPFGFNISQKTAVERAMNNSFSVIEGPPGTGKTQTILNIIANAVMDGKSIAVVSSNNSATANVLEKLKKHDVGFIAAYLGNARNKEQFIESQTGLLPDMTGWHFSDNQVKHLFMQIESLALELDSLLQSKNMLAAVNKKLDSIALEAKLYNQDMVRSRKDK